MLLVVHFVHSSFLALVAAEPVLVRIVHVLHAHFAHGQNSVDKTTPSAVDQRNDGQFCGLAHLQNFALDTLQHKTVAVRSSKPKSKILNNLIFEALIRRNF